MVTNAEETQILASDEIFEFGDATLVQLAAQRPTLVKHRTTVPQRDGNTIARLEEKLDLAIRHILTLQARLESMDVTLAKVLNR